MIKQRTKTALFVAITSILVSSCGFLSPMDAKKEIRTAKNELSRINASLENHAATYITQPKADLTPIPVDRSPAWMKRIISINETNREFDIVQKLILGDSGITGVMNRSGVEEQPGVMSQLGEQAIPNHPVTLRHNGTVKSALDHLAAILNYTYTVKDNLVIWSAFEGKTFFLPVGGGNYSYMIGKKDESGSGGSGGSQSNSSMGGGSGSNISSSSFDIDRDQFASTRGTDVNPFVEAEAAVKAIVGNMGQVAKSVATSSLFVKTTPDRMVMVSDYIDSLDKNLASQVVLDIEVIQVTTEHNNGGGVNWKTTKDLTRSVLEFDGESAINNFTNSVPSSFRGVRNTGSGSVDVLINALEEVGSVAVLTKRRIQTRSGRMAEISLSELKGYVAQSKAIATMDIGTSSELIQGILQGGTTLNAIAHVHGDRVSVNLSLTESKINPVETVGTEANFVQLPNVDATGFKVEAIARSGTTVVTASIRRQVSKENSSSPINAKFLPTYKGTQNVTEDIYVLVTPRIVRS